jgi:excisionase family DNA binding protein
MRRQPFSGKNFTGTLLVTMNGTETIQPLLLTPREAAKALAICERTLYALTKTGELPAVRMGRCVRYDLDALKAWIKKSSEIR